MPLENRLDELTTREREVLDLVRLGLTNEEIAGRLGITEAGAKYHVSQILSKLGVATLCVCHVLCRSVPLPASCSRALYLRGPE